MSDLWTITELSDRVEDALAEGYRGPPTGRVRAVPDQRTIRYYTTLGLLDRAAEMRGRTAFYSLRHLEQLVAIKRLQAKGLSLAEVQTQLAAASPVQVARIAGLVSRAGSTQNPPAQASLTATPPGRSAKFWAAPPDEEELEKNTVRARVASSSKAAASPRKAAAPRTSPQSIVRTVQRVELAPGFTLEIASDAAPTETDLEQLRVLSQSLVAFVARHPRLSPTAPTTVPPNEGTKS